MALTARPRSAENGEKGPKAEAEVKVEPPEPEPQAEAEAEAEAPERQRRRRRRKTASRERQDEVTESGFEFWNELEVQRIKFLVRAGLGEGTGPGGKGLGGKGLGGAGPDRKGQSWGRETGVG